MPARRASCDAESPRFCRRRPRLVSISRGMPLTTLPPAGCAVVICSSLERCLAMERKKATDFPQELLNLFDRYVHGDIGRREFLDGAQKFATGSVTAVALWEMLKPNYAWAVQVPADDKRIKTERVSVDSPKGHGS